MASLDHEVRAAGVHAVAVGPRRGHATARVDSARPRNDEPQNGPISLMTERAPVLRHTQRRLSSNDGDGADRVAITLAQPGDMAAGRHEHAEHGHADRRRDDRDAAVAQDLPERRAAMDADQPTVGIHVEDAGREARKTQLRSNTNRTGGREVDEREQASTTAGDVDPDGIERAPASTSVRPSGSDRDGETGQVVAGPAGPTPERERQPPVGGGVGEGARRPGRRRRRRPTPSGPASSANSTANTHAC